MVVDDDRFELPLRGFLPGLDLAALEPHRGLIEPEFRDLGRDVLRCAIQTLVLRAQGRAIVVGTCVGEAKARPEIPAWDRRSGTGFLDRPRRAGVEPAAVAAVLCTHLHLDHVGWNTRRGDGRWAPTFPNARYLVGRAEAATRRAVLAEAAATGRLVVPAHFRGRRRAYVREAGGGFAPVFPDGPG